MQPEGAISDSPFGMIMPGRSYDGGSGYRYGFQGQETDNEMLGGAVSFKYRVHDARIGRFLSVDPLAPDYPWNSPYAFSENRVIDGVELEGLEYEPINNWDSEVDQETLKKNLGEDYLEGMKMTYEEYHEFRLPQIQEYYKDEIIDCADLCLKTTVHFAVENRLPFEFKSYRANFQERFGTLKPDYSINQEFSQKVVDEVFTIFKPLGANEFYNNNYMFKNISPLEARPGDVITAKYGEGHYHAMLINMIEPIYTSQNRSIFSTYHNRISAYQGNLDDENRATPVAFTQFTTRGLLFGQFDHRPAEAQPIGGVISRKWNFTFMSTVR